MRLLFLNLKVGAKLISASEKPSKTPPANISSQCLH